MLPNMDHIPLLLLIEDVEEDDCKLLGICESDDVAAAPLLPLLLLLLSGVLPTPRPGCNLALNLATRASRSTRSLSSDSR